MKARQEGFTLIELVIVIVILGVLAASALPRFLDLTQEARVASVKGMAGGLQSSASVARAACIIDTSCNSTLANYTVTIEGAAVGMRYGYPSVAGIQAAMDLQLGDFSVVTGTPTADDVMFRLISGSSSCQSTYRQSTGAGVGASVTTELTCT